MVKMYTRIFDVLIAKIGMSYKQTVARILIADSNPLFREKMKQIIADHFDSILTSEASSEQETLTEISRHTFDVLVLDLELPDGNGFTILNKILITIPDVRVLVISLFPVEQYEENVFRAGAYGYMSKVNLSDEFITALQTIFEGKKYFISRGNGNPGKKSS